MRMKSLGVLVAAMLVVGACGAASQPASDPAPGSPSDNPPAGAPVEVTVGTDTGEALKFDPAEVPVRAGADVRLTFENRSAVPHNWTLEGPVTVATSTIVAPGATETVEFTAPDPGDYTFVCTLHPGMGGTLVVEAG